MQQACVYCTYSTVQMMKSLNRELKPSEKLKWEMEKRWGEILTVDGQVLRGDFYIRAHKRTGCW